MTGRPRPRDVRPAIHHPACPARTDPSILPCPCDLARLAADREPDAEDADHGQEPRP